MADVARDPIEDVRHVAEVRGGEDRVEELALASVLFALTGEHTWPEEHREVAMCG